MYRNPPRRAGFTLIELLVVIAIIAILSSLALVGVMKVLSKGPEVQNRNDLLQLDTALQKFYEKHKFYPPSQIKLCSTIAEYGNPPTTTLDKVSLSYLGAMWPNLDRTGVTPFYWKGGTTAVPPGGVTLEGHQCLVFFLGGPNSVGIPPQGFFNNPSNPTVQPAATVADRVKYYDFKPDRCVYIGTSGFASYVDAHGKGKPFVYFSSNKRPDGYNPTDNASLSVSPYFSQPGKYHNPTTYQLISAGADGLFGPGGLWGPNNPATGSGNDDVANFHPSILGAP